MATLRRVRLTYDDGDRLPYQVGDRVQVRYTRQVDRAGDGEYHVVDPLYADQIATWWPIYDGRGIKTVGFGRITRIWDTRHPEGWPWTSHCWVKIEDEIA